MNKKELVTALAESTSLSKKDCEAVLSAFTETVTAELKAGGKVQLIGFGSFEVRLRRPRLPRLRRARP